MDIERRMEKKTGQPPKEDKKQKSLDQLLPAVELALQVAVPGSVTAAFLRLLKEQHTGLAHGNITVNDKRLVWHGPQGRLLRIKLTSNQLDLAVSNQLIPFIRHDETTPVCKPHSGNYSMTDYIARSIDQLPCLLGIFSSSTTRVPAEASRVAPLGAFAQSLEALIGRPSTLRPFVCHGLPQTCDVFIVGINATTGTDFWSFWNDKSGFDYKNWEKAYLTERQKRGKNGISPTRAMINWIGQSLPGVPILETNVYAKPTPSASDLIQADRDTSVFAYLLQAIRPKAILCHGQETAMVVQPLVKQAELRCSVLETKHLRFWSKERARNLAAQIEMELEQWRA